MSEKHLSNKFSSIDSCKEVDMHGLSLNSIFSIFSHLMCVSLATRLLKQIIIIIYFLTFIYKIFKRQTISNEINIYLLTN